MKYLPIFLLFNLIIFGCDTQLDKDVRNKIMKKINSPLSYNYYQDEDSVLFDFSLKWKADSVGKNGFRDNHYSFDKTTRKWLINGKNFRGYSLERILGILGKPTDSGFAKEDKLLIVTYAVRKINGLPEESLILYFDQNYNLDDVVKETGL